MLFKLNQLIVFIILGLSANSYGFNSDPFDTASCESKPLDLSQALKFLKPLQTRLELGEFQLFHKERLCSEVTGCDSWKTNHAFNAIWTPAPTRRVKRSYALPISSTHAGKVVLALKRKVLNVQLEWNSIKTPSFVTRECKKYTDCPELTAWLGPQHPSHSNRAKDKKEWRLTTIFDHFKNGEISTNNMRSDQFQHPSRMGMQDAQIKPFINKQGFIGEDCLRISSQYRMIVDPSEGLYSEHKTVIFSQF